MDELRDMTSKVNSLEEIKEKYRKGVIETFLYIYKNRKEIANEKTGLRPIENLRKRFSSLQYNKCFDDSLGSNDRWGIVGKRNFFGLEAEFVPEDKEQDGKIVKGNVLFLKAMSGRFQMQKFPQNIFPNKINITDLLARENSEQFREVEEFYNMTNREVFEKYGIDIEEHNYDDTSKNLIANCVILDSLLQRAGSDMKYVYCYTPKGYAINIQLEDGTEINANSANDNGWSNCERGVTIKKDGKEARVDFDAINIGENPKRLTNINDLEVENVVYTGAPELIAKLQQAMQEQFKSQQELTEDRVASADETTGKEKKVESKSEQSAEEKTGAEKIIEFMKANKLEPHDLSLALAALLARKEDQRKIEQHIADSFVQEKQTPETPENTTHIDEL